VVVKMHSAEKPRCRNRIGKISMVLETQKSQPDPSVDGVGARKAERRRRSRAALQWVVHVSRGGGQHVIASRTRNVSSEGFYCLVQEPFESGERVECTVCIPVPKSTRSDDVLWLKCQARVLRVEAVMAETAYGVAFKIEEYSIVPIAPMQITRAERIDGNGCATL
jgi:hypothetical protein